MFRFYVLFIPLFTADGALLYVNPGENVTLSCFYTSSVKYMCWYKQIAGEQPRIISSFYKHSPDTNNFHHQFKDNKRFSIHTGAGFYHLNISNVQSSDSAMYYCGHTSITVTEFDNGTFLVLKESSRRSFLQQPASGSVQPGDSVTLNCTVQTGTGDPEHSVYWFKKEKPESSHLGIMYIHSSSRQCVHSLESPEQSCVHSFYKRNVSLADAGTYYCAVASCGHILFEKGTTLEVKGKQDDTLPLLMQCMVAALLVSVILNIILLCVLCKMSRRKHLHSGGLQDCSTVPQYTACSPSEDSDALQYVALDFKKRQGKTSRQRSTEETIYAGVKPSNLK